MPDLYFNCDTNKALLKEYAELCESIPINGNNFNSAAVESVRRKERKEEIRQHIAFEVLAQYADIHGSES